MVITRDKSAAQILNIKTYNQSFDRVEQFIHLGTTLTNQNSIHEELKSENASYYTALNLLSSSLLSKNVKIKAYRTIILPIALFGCETGSPTQRELCRLRVFENRLLKRIFGTKRDEVKGEKIK